MTSTASRVDWARLLIELARTGRENPDLTGYGFRLHPDTIDELLEWARQSGESVFSGGERPLLLLGFPYTEDTSKDPAVGQIWFGPATDIDRGPEHSGNLGEAIVEARLAELDERWRKAIRQGLMALGVDPVASSASFDPDEATRMIEHAARELLDDVDEAWEHHAGDDL